MTRLGDHLPEWAKWIITIAFISLSVAAMLKSFAVEGSAVQRCAKE